MDREAFKKRMLSLKSYRELNPDKGYWDWKIQAFDVGGNTYVTTGRSDDKAGYDAYGNMQVIATKDRDGYNFDMPEVVVTANKYVPKTDALIAYEADLNALLGTEVLSAVEELARYTDYGDVAEHMDNAKLAYEGNPEQAALNEIENAVYNKIGAAIPFVGGKAVKAAANVMLKPLKKLPLFYKRLLFDAVTRPKETAKGFIDGTYPSSYKRIKNHLQLIHELDDIKKQQQFAANKEDALARAASNKSKPTYEQIPLAGDIGFANKRAKDIGFTSNAYFQGKSYINFDSPTKSSGVLTIDKPKASARVYLRSYPYSNILLTPEELVGNAVHERLHGFNRFFPEIENLTVFSPDADYYTVAGRNVFVPDFVSDQFSFLNANVGLSPYKTHQSSPDEFLADLMSLRVMKGDGKSFDVLSKDIQEDIVAKMANDYMFSTSDEAKNRMRTVLFNLAAEGYEDGGEVHDAGMLPEVVVTPEEWQVEEPGLWDKFTNTVSVLYNNAARKIKNFFEEEDVGEVIDLSNQQVTRVTPDTKNLTAIYGNEFVESAANNIRTKKQFEETTDTLIGDKKIPLSKISTFYGIENGKLKAGPLSTFSDNTTVIANRAKNIGKVKEIYRISKDSEDYKWAKQYDELNKTKNLIMRDSLCHHFLDSLGIEYNDKWYRRIIGQKSAQDIVTRMYYDKNTDEYTKKYIRFVVWNHSTKYQKRANKILLWSLPHLITEKNDTLPFTSAKVYGPKYLFSNEYGDAVFVHRLNKLSNALLDSLNTKLKESPMYPILIDNGRYSHYQTNSPNYTTYTAYDFARDPKNMYVIGTTNSYENGGETGELSKENEQRLSNAIIHSIRKDNMNVAKSLMQRGSDEYIPIPHPQPGIASLVGEATMLPYLDTVSDMYNLAQSVYEKDPAGTAINTLALTLPYATSKAINKITRSIPTVKGYKESVEAQMNVVLNRLKADLAKQAEWDNMVFRSAERVYDQDVIDRAIETGTVDRLNQVKDLYENNLENLPKVRMADNLPNGERGRIQLTPEAEARHKAGISPEDKDFEILVDRSIDPNQEIIDHEFRHFNQYMEKGSPDINTTATSTRSGVKLSKRNKLDPARSTYFGKEGESEAYLKNIYEDMKSNGFDPNNYSDFKKYLKGLSDRDSKKKAVAQFRSNIDAFKFMKKMPLIAAIGVGLTAMNQNKEQSN